MKTFTQLMEEIANVAGSATTDTGGVSEPPTAKTKDKKKVVLFKNVDTSKRTKPND